MEQKLNPNDAAVKDAKVLHKREECVSDMVHRSNDAAAKGAKIELRREECALGMVHRSNDAAVKDEQIKLSRAESASGMVQQQGVQKSSYQVRRSMEQRFYGVMLWVVQINLNEGGIQRHVQRSNHV